AKSGKCRPGMPCWPLIAARFRSQYDSKMPQCDQPAQPCNGKRGHKQHGIGADKRTPCDNGGDEKRAANRCILCLLQICKAAPTGKYSEQKTEKECRNHYIKHHRRMEKRRRNRA